MIYKIFFSFVCLFIFSQTPANAQLKCTRMYPAGIGKMGIYNNCDMCMSSSVAWCDGSIKKFPIAANSGATFDSCLGTATLVGENPCSNNSGSIKNPDKLAKKESQLFLVDYKKSSSSKIFSKEVIASASCSASNDAGDKCSINCPDGQAAQCTNASGAGTPTCSCKIS